MPKTYSNKPTLVAGALVMFLGTLLGALGAHSLQPALESSGHVSTWETAVLYQLVHGLAIFVTGIWLGSRRRVSQPHTLKLSATLWLAGILLFSGSLYFLSLGGPRWLGPVTPLGGLCFLGGWLTLIIGVIGMKTEGDSSP